MTATQKTSRHRAAALLATVSGLAIMAIAGAAQAAPVVINGVTETVPGTHPSPWVVDNGLTISTNAVSQLDVTGGGDVTVTNCGPVTIGQSASGNGTLNIDGAGSTFNNGACGVTVGSAGHGTLLITNGGLLTTGAISSIGSAGAGVGTATVTSGSNWQFSGMVVGGGGTGTLNVGGGALLTQTNCNTTAVGFGSAAHGTVNVFGANTHWDNGGCILVVGEGGEGLLGVLNGALVDNVGQLTIAQGFGSGLIEVNGANSQLISTNNIFIGGAGSGELKILNGGKVVDVNASIGQLNGSHGVVTVDGAGSTWTNSGALFVADGALGSLTISNGGLVTSATGNVTGSMAGGQLSIIDANSKWQIAGAFGASGQVTGPTTISISGGGVLSNTSAVVANGSNSNLQIFMDGAGSQWINTGSLSMGGGSNSTFFLGIANGAVVSSTTGDFQRGDLRISGAGSAWTTSGNVKVGSSGAGNLVLSNGGLLSVAGGAGTVTFGQSGGSFGVLAIGAIGGNAPVAPGVLQAAVLTTNTINGGSGQLQFNHNSSNYVFSTQITGAGSVVVRAGTTILTGANTYTGFTNVGSNSGTLIVNGSLGSTPVGVALGSTLGGSGVLGGNVTIANGGRLRGLAGQTLTMGNLFLNNTTAIDVTLGAPSATRLFQVNGTLTLDGQLNVADAGAFGAGLYRLIDYTGALTDNGLAIGTTPGGVLAADLSVQTGVAGQVNLVYASSGPLQFWNGPNTSANGTVTGGAGTWNTTTTNWTNANGTANGDWDGIFGIFTGTGGAVTVDNVGGAVGATGMQFAANGYSVGGGALTLTGATPAIRVGDGTAGGAAYVATISAAIAGAGGLNKTDLGKLVLSGANTYTGATTLSGGVLQISNNNNLGAAANGLVFDGGVLAFTSGVDTNRAVSILAGGGGINVNVINVNLSGAITGAGAFTKTGSGILQFAQGGSYSGQITVAAGGLTLLGALPNANVLVQSQAVLQGTGAIGGPVVVENGGYLLNFSGNTLTTGALTLNNTSHLYATLGAPSVTPSFQVNGALVLDGILDVSGQAGFGSGLYRLINYTGALTNNGLTFGSLPAGSFASDMTIQTSVGGQVNLIYAAPGTLNFWNGSTLAPTGAVVAGPGTWKLGTTNWTNAAGSASGGWNGGFGIFTGNGGTVVVDNSGGAVSATGLQFAASNIYTVDGDVLTLTGAAPTIRTGDGSADSINAAAVINATVAGSNGLIKTDEGYLTLAGVNTYTGGTTLEAGSLQINTDAGLGAASGGLTLNGGIFRSTGVIAMNRTVTIGGGSAKIGVSGASLTLNGALNGSGNLIKQNNGLLVLAGGGNFNGDLTIQAGVLRVTGSTAANSLTMQTNTTLEGTGSIAGTVDIWNNATLKGAAGQVLTMGGLTLDNASKVNVTLGAPSAAGLFAIGGDLTLDGALNITNGGGFGAGLYRLMNYTGALTDNGLDVGTTPAGFAAADMTVQTSVAGQVNLIYTTPTFRFWNGSTVAPTGTVEGGGGTWKLGTNNWTNAAGAASGAWDGGLAIFMGSAAPVTIDNSGGAITASGLQFVEDGYGVTGDTLTLTGAAPTIRVGDGSIWAPFTVAVIAAPIAGTGGLTKTDLGALMLLGANTFTGGLTIDDGILGVDADNSLGAAGGVVNLAGGELYTAGSFASSRTFNVQSDSAIRPNGGVTLTLQGGLAGSAALEKRGAGELVLAGANSYSGLLNVTGGKLTVDGSVAGGVTMQSATTLTGAGTIAGAVDIADGATLVGEVGQTLIMGSLALHSGSLVDTTLGFPNGQTVFYVTGGLTLDGVMNVHDAGGFGLGVYRIIDYVGALTDNGLTIGAVPAGVPAGNLLVQTNIANQVNLVYSAATPLQFWNGVTTAPTGTVNGGSGTWRLGATNWTDAGGATSTAWTGIDGVFAGPSGVVTIDNTGGAVGAASLQFASNGYVIGGGALALTGGAPTLRVGDGSAAGAGFTATINSVLTGAGGLIKTDLGTLVLSGANTYTGGATLMGGTVSVGANANLGAAAGGITFNGGALAATSSFASARSLAFVGDGTIVTGSGVVLDLSGPLTGSGAFTKAGAGVLKLSGAGAFNGPTTITGGTLQANGVLGGTVLVQSGAKLQGIGTVGSTTVASGATLSPGNSIGTLTVAGDLTFAAGSTYEVELNAAGQSDLTHATGAVTIQGGAVSALPAAGLYSLGTRYTVVTADGGRTGTFTTLNQTTLSQPFLRFGLAYDATHAFLDVVRNTVAFCDVAETRNQCAAATGAESLGQGATIYNAVANLPSAAAARAAFDGLSGEIHASARGALVDDSRFVRDAAIGRVFAGGERTVWGQVFGAQGSADSDGNAARLTRSVSGFLVGVDAPVDGGWRLGALAGYSQGRFKSNARASSGESDTYHLGVYGGGGQGAFGARFGAAYAWHDLSTDRMVAFGAFSGVANSGARARTGQVFGEVGYSFGEAGRTIEPFAGLAYVSVSGDGFTEQGSAAALRGSDDDTVVTFATLGVRGKAGANIQGAAVSLRGTIAWRGAYGDVTPEQRIAFASGGSTFTVAGAPIAKDAVVIDAGLGVALSDRARLSVTYAGQLGSDARDHSGKLTLTIGF